MVREAVPVGTERKKLNGYTVVKTEDGWEFKHRLVAEDKLGRKLKSYERVVILDGDKANFDPDNIEVRVVKRPNEQRALAQRVEDLELEVHELTKRVTELE